MASYTYDSLSQLKTVVRGSDTYAYSYDTGGNLLSVTKNGTVVQSYTYGHDKWKDLLTAYNGQTITYDAIGNPLSYYNGTRWSFTWENGRSLATASGNSKNISYIYDATGLRTSKTVDGVTHTYYYVDGQLRRETYGTTVLDFFYDADGKPYAFTYNGTAYYYITNLQGDVMYIVDADGNYKALYEYAPYGKVLGASGTMATINPLRYRGYYYDTETGLYYLQSRYYDPNTGRFLNADSYASTGQGFIGHNMFAYCKNNPSNYIDADGYDAIWIQEAKSAEGFGHSGLLVQDESGTWFFFYWGPIDENADISELLLGIASNCVFVKVETDGYDLTCTGGVVAALSNSGDEFLKKRSNAVTYSIYMSGDYTNTFDYLVKLSENASKIEYNLLINNCVQQTCRALSYSNNMFNSMYLIPNVAVFRVMWVMTTYTIIDTATDIVKNIIPSILPIRGVWP